MPALRGRTLFISGASRGIGLAIATRAARDGANVAFIAKTGTPHARLNGTVHTAAEAIERAGGQALAIVGDVRDEQAIEHAVASTVERFGGIDVCINNASALDVSGIEDLTAKRYDLMQNINTRGTFLVSQACLPHLKKSTNPHILTMSPPITLDPKWLTPFTAYTVSKYGMSLIAMGLAHQFRYEGIASNTLWPRTMIATDAIRNNLGDDAIQRSRTPQICADAAYQILSRPSRGCTGNGFLCEDVLAHAGVNDLQRYNVAGPDAELGQDFYVESVTPPKMHGGPPRVQPSKKVEANWDAGGNPL